MTLLGTIILFTTIYLIIGMVFTKFVGHRIKLIFSSEDDKRDPGMNGSFIVTWPIFLVAVPFAVAVWVSGKVFVYLTNLKRRKSNEE